LSAKAGSSTLIVTLVTSISFFQWRSRIDGDLRSLQHGIATRKFLTTLSTSR
jgi:hypothetical protein